MVILLGLLLLSLISLRSFLASGRYSCNSRTLAHYLAAPGCGCFADREFVGVLCVSSGREDDASEVMSVTHGPSMCFQPLPGDGETAV